MAVYSRAQKSTATLNWRFIMIEKQTMTLVEFEDECEEIGYTKFIFTDENQKQDDYNVRFALTFDSMRIYYNGAYNKVLFGCKYNCIEFNRIVKVEKDLGLDFCTKYTLYCKNKFLRKMRVFNITAIR